MAATAPVPSIVYATGSGGTTLDQDECGGNPFATALIELARNEALSIRRLLPKLRDATRERSAQHQTPTWTLMPAHAEWRSSGPSGGRGERRIALVLVVASYADLNNPQLSGAAHDERRISAMLASHGFSVTQGVAPEHAALRRALRSFHARSQDTDVAVVYCTGHGLEHAAKPYLLPGDYPFAQGYEAAVLRERAVPVLEIASACKARKLNLVFFAGCRTLA